MIEVMRTTDPVQLSFALSVLESAGLSPFVADRFMAAAEGGISAFPRRLLVPEEFADEAKALLKEALASAEAQALDADVDDRDDL